MKVNTIILFLQLLEEMLLLCSMLILLLQLSISIFLKSGLVLICLLFITINLPLCTHKTTLTLLTFTNSNNSINMDFFMIYHPLLSFLNTLLSFLNRVLSNPKNQNLNRILRLNRVLTNPIQFKIKTQSEF